jgi:hypothetical protein
MCVQRPSRARLRCCRRSDQMPPEWCRRRLQVTSRSRPRSRPKLDGLSVRSHFACMPNHWRRPWLYFELLSIIRGPQRRSPIGQQSACCGIEIRGTWELQADSRKGCWFGLGPSGAGAHYGGRSGAHKNGDRFDPRRAETSGKGKSPRNRNQPRRRKSASRCPRYIALLDDRLVRTHTAISQARIVARNALVSFLRRKAPVDSLEERI